MNMIIRNHTTKIPVYPSESAEILHLDKNC